jgi:hypothetical protein
MSEVRKTGGCVPVRDLLHIAFRHGRVGEVHPFARLRWYEVTRVSSGKVATVYPWSDHEHGRYVESVTAPAGTVLHATAERLTDHRGHRSAKFRRRPG